MRSLIILVLTLATAIALSGKELRSRNVVVPAGRLQGRITNGKYAVEGQFPYQASLHIKYNSTYYKWCGGTLIHHEWVLTAAHCTLDAKHIEVKLGTINRLVDGLHVRHRNIFTHENYEPDNFDKHDIALLKIAHTEYTDKIQPATLPDSDTDYRGKYAIASGWGLIGDLPSNSTDKLKYARLGVIPNKVCDEKFLIFETNICTATINGVNICQGDSGGPLVLENTNNVIGVVSYSGECTGTSPGVFTRVHKYLDWIEKITDGAVTAKKLRPKGN